MLESKFHMTGQAVKCVSTHFLLKIADSVKPPRHSNLSSMVVTMEPRGVGVTDHRPHKHMLHTGLKPLFKPVPWCFVPFIKKLPRKRSSMAEVREIDTATHSP